MEAIIESNINGEKFSLGLVAYHGVVRSDGDGVVPPPECPIGLAEVEAKTDRKRKTEKRDPLRNEK